jgi:hypothetical protein
VTGEQDLRCREWPDTGLFEQLRRECACERLDLARELALLAGQLLHTARDSAERPQCAAQLDVAVPLWLHRRQSTQQLRACQ